MWGMRFPGVLASDFSGVFEAVLAFLAVATILGGAVIAASASVGRRRWWGLLLAAWPIAVGLYMALWASAAGCDLMTYLIFVAPELLLGVVAIIFWSLPRE
jgi:hypothetical protein